VVATPRCAKQTVAMNSTISLQQPTCKQDGINDLYGIGIRICLYLQAVALLLSFALTKSPVALAQTASTVTLATFAVLVRQTIRREITAAEVTIIYWLISPQIFCGILLIIRNAKQWRTGIFSILIWTAMRWWYIYFWFTGMDRLPKRCETQYYFFFAKLDIFGWVRTFMKVTVVMFEFSSLCALFTMPFMAFASKLNVFGDGGLNVQSRPWRLLSILLLLPVCFAPFTLSVVSAEMIIKWNNITGVNDITTAGQLIPLLAGIGQVLATIYYIVIDEMPKNVKFEDALVDSFETILPDVKLNSHPTIEEPCLHKGEDARMGMDSSLSLPIARRWAPSNTARESIICTLRVDLGSSFRLSTFGIGPTTRETSEMVQNNENSHALAGTRDGEDVVQGHAVPDAFLSPDYRTNTGRHRNVPQEGPWIGVAM
jgi:hypothetical protein